MILYVWAMSIVLLKRMVIGVDSRIVDKWSLIMVGVSFTHLVQFVFNLWCKVGVKEGCMVWNSMIILEQRRYIMVLNLLVMATGESLRKLFVSGETK